MRDLEDDSREGDGRLRRHSSGLVFNPGSGTVDCMRSSAAGCRFSVSTGASGEQQLTLITEDLGRVQPSPPRPALPAAVAPTPEESAGELFARFVTADRSDLACQLFEQLMRRCDGANHATARGEQPHRRLQRFLGSSVPWRARSVWAMIQSRAQRPEYAGAPLHGKTRAVVCGAGPCGLRAALELALLHAEVRVVEKRSAVEASGRINRLHLWEWCKQDILAWGGKIFDPPGGAFGGDNDFCHIGIGELQLLLLKNALLLGVKLLFDTEALHIEDDELLCNDSKRVPCNVLVIANGANSPLTQALGLRSVALGLRGKGSAIGVVANFVNTRDTHQMALRQFSWARQFNTPLFTQLEEKTAVNLENVVYYKGQGHHYMVMTPTKRSLLDTGVLRDAEASSQLLRGANVDLQRLGQMVKSIASFFGLPTELCSSQGAMIFDFSGVRRLESPASIVGGTFVCAVGDALLEPFWPEGLGIMRGFMSALDAASAVVVAADGRPEDAMAQMAQTYNVLKSVAAQTASQCLQKDPRQYRLQPKSRYVFSHL